MSVRAKLLVIVLFVAIVPLSVSAFTALRTYQRAHDGTLAELQRGAAEAGALLAAEHLDGLAGGVQLAIASIPWAALSDAERQGALWLVYRQSDAIAAVALLDERGAELDEAVFLAEPSAHEGLGAHPPATEELYERLLAAAPASDAPLGALAVGEAFAHGRGPPLLPVATAVAGPGGERWTVAVAMSLGPLCARVAGLGSPPLALSVLDRHARVVCGGSGAPLVSAPAPLAARLGDTEPIEYRAGDIRMVAAAAMMHQGWVVLAEQPATIAAAVADRMRRRALLWIAIGLLAALAGGLYLARGVSRPVQALAVGADELAKGNLGHRLPPGDRDEFGRLAAAFNHMGAEIQRRNHEIRAWNDELTERVEARSRELEQAQKLLLESQKLAAMSSLAAGVAHEINNPLTGVLGLSQLLQEQARAAGEPEARLRALGAIENEARRIRDIVQTLLALSSERGREGYTAVDLRRVVDDALELASEALSEQAIDVQRRYAARLPAVRGNEGQLRQAVGQLVANAVAAMARGGTLTLAVEAADDRLVRVTVIDDGRGIAPEHLARVFEPFFTTKTVWQGKGLGLTVAYRVTERHQGTIQIASEPGSGTTVTVTLPADHGGAHLV